MDGHRRNWGTALAFELAPAALLNFAVAYAVATVLRSNGLVAAAPVAALLAGVAAFVAAWHCLRGLDSSGARLALPAFEPLPIESLDPADEDELLLTDLVVEQPAAEWHAAEQQPARDELLLDDIVDSIAPDSRVVRLFDPGATPTAGELRARIDRHLGSGPPRTASPDATQELHEALAALRQSLR